MMNQQMNPPHRNRLRRQGQEWTDTHLEAIDHASPLYESTPFEYIKTGGVSRVHITRVAGAAETWIAGLQKSHEEKLKVDVT